jgi:hypothetical protein
METLMAGGDAPLPARGEATAGEEPLPLSRQRRGSQRIAVLAILIAGLTMLLVALLSSGDAASVGLTALAGTTALGLSAVAVAEVVSLRAVGVAALVVGIACVASAFVPDLFDGPELGRLLAGGGMVLASGVLLPRDPGTEPGVRI